MDKLLESIKYAKPVERDMLLMSKDTVVMTINMDEGKYEVNNELLLPFGLKGKLRRVPHFSEVKSKYDDTQRQIALRKNNEAITSWLANRILLLSRANAKWLYNAIKAEQVSTDVERAKVSLLCRAVSINDSYWVKMSDEKITWLNVNIRENPLNEIIAQIALHGKSLTLQGSFISPEFTTHGVYAKAWRRHEDGSLWLYKKGDKDNSAARIEVMVSNILDKLNVNHCKYIAGEDEGHYVSMCKAMSTEDIGILHGMDFIYYCLINDYNPDEYMMEIDSESIYKMWIIDYLIANRDRHGQNWGFYYDLETMKILGCHPLYDHNNAFDNEWMNNPNADYQFRNMTIRRAAYEANKHVTISIKEPITRKDFITNRQWNCFSSRARELGISLE